MYRYLKIETCQAKAHYDDFSLVTHPLEGQAKLLFERLEVLTAYVFKFYALRILPPPLIWVYSGV